MKNRIMQTISALLVLAAASLALAHQVGKAPDAKQKKENKMVQWLRPDLTVGIQVQPTGNSVTFIVYNKCKGKAPASKVQIKATKDDGSGFYYAVVDVPLLEPGAKTEVTFRLQPDAPVKTFAQRYFTLTADPFNKIKEASEGNNVWNPNSQPFPEKGGYCDPPYNN
jgi:hypothetical protein